jgi:hypothetical protein
LILTVKKLDLRNVKNLFQLDISRLAQTRSGEKLSSEKQIAESSKIAMIAAPYDCRPIG